MTKLENGIIDNRECQTIAGEAKSNCQKKGCMKRATRIIKTTVRTQILLCQRHYEGFKK